MRILKIVLLVLVLIGIGLGIWHKQAPKQFAEKIGPVTAQLGKFGIAQKAQNASSSLSSSASSLTEQAPTAAAQEELKTLTERGKVAVEEAQKVLGTVIEVDDTSDKAAHEKALEYGKYAYCKQVVEEWEKSNKTN